MITIESAREKILNSVSVLETEIKNILESLDYVIAEDIYSDDDIPPFDNSAMDGFAVISDDTINASETNPIRLEIIDTIRAGYVSSKSIQRGQAIRIMTGAPVPKGADAVAKVEDTREIPSQSFVEVLHSVKKGENIRLAGESVKKGQLVIPKGKIIRPSEMGMLASINKKEVSVFRRPKVALISTGDELVPPGEPITQGKIRDSNRYSLYGQVIKAFGFPIDLGIVKDDAELLEQKFREGLSIADVLITSAGVSVGDYDVVKDVLSKLGEINYWKVAMKPGKPQAFGIVDGKPVFGLPGNPVSSMIVFQMFVKPALLKMSGRTEIFEPTFKAIMEHDIKSEINRTEFVRAIITKRDDKYYAKSTGSQGSGILFSMVLANGLIAIPTGRDEIKAGEEVEAQWV